MFLGLFSFSATFSLYLLKTRFLNHRRTLIGVASSQTFKQHSQPTDEVEKIQNNVQHPKVIHLLDNVLKGVGNLHFYILVETRLDRDPFG